MNARGRTTHESLMCAGNARHYRLLVGIPERRDHDDQAGGEAGADDGGAGSAAGKGPPT
jgi:hypothetical protein